MRSIFISSTFLLTTIVGHCQLSISNGVGLPTRDTLRVLMVFAEVDYEDGPCQAGMTETFKGTWGTDNVGKTNIPACAGEYLDVEFAAGKQPVGVVTKHFHEASFGQYVILGDYLNKVVTIPCKELRPGQNGVRQVLLKLDTWQPADSSLHTNSGLTLKDFDLWTIGKKGEKKIKEPDGRIDLLYIIWRNNRMLTGRTTGGNSGYGVARNHGRAFKDMKGLNNMASFNSESGVKVGEGVTIAEHLHGIFGGNNWHSGSGAGTHTFLCQARNFGLTGQSASTSQMTCAWDRWMQKWKHPEKKWVTSAMDLEGRELRTELISIDRNPDGVSFILRDFSTSGDAARIKLPYVSDDSLTKNQYIWLENHQFINETDRYLRFDCSNTNGGKYPKGTPGVYAYIQVGKDDRDGGSEIYSSSHSAPNGLASPFYPLTAEGNHDLAYRYDLVQGKENRPCWWNNANIPLDRKRNVPNPFTGHSDLYNLTDSNDDGKLLSGDRIQTGLSEVIGGEVIHNYFTNGDWKDAFSQATGNTYMGIYTNPSPVPVYTLATNFQFKRFGIKDGELGKFENRTIWLNGLSIAITELPQGRIKIDVRWDDFEVKENVRWCGNIRLSPNHIDSTRPSLILLEKVRIDIDRGKSPVLPIAKTKDKKGRWDFGETTIFTLSNGSVMELRSGSTLHIKEDSKLVLAAGSKLTMSRGSTIIADKNAEILIEEGAELIQHPKSKIRKR